MLTRTRFTGSGSLGLLFEDYECYATRMHMNMQLISVVSTCWARCKLYSYPEYEALVINNKYFKAGDIL